MHIYFISWNHWNKWDSQALLSYGLFLKNPLCNSDIAFHVFPKYLLTHHLRQRLQKWIFTRILIACCHNSLLFVFHLRHLINQTHLIDIFRIIGNLDHIADFSFLQQFFVVLAHIPESIMIDSFSRQGGCFSGMAQ